MSLRLDGRVRRPLGLELRRHRSRVLVHPRRCLRPGLLRAVSLGVSVGEGSFQAFHLGGGSIRHLGG